MIAETFGADSPKSLQDLFARGEPLLANTGLANTGLANAGLANTGLANTGLANTVADRPDLHERAPFRAHHAVSAAIGPTWIADLARAVTARHDRFA
jgi:hypothetical protein